MPFGIVVDKKLVDNCGLDGFIRIVNIWFSFIYFWFYNDRAPLKCWITAHYASDDHVVVTDTYCIMQNIFFVCTI